jgi:hypothetical protein
MGSAFLGLSSTTARVSEWTLICETLVSAKLSARESGKES